MQLRNPATGTWTEARRSRGGGIWLLAIIGIWTATATVVNCVTHPQDVDALKALWTAWQQTPSLWATYDINSDPCDSGWPGIICNATDPTSSTIMRVTGILVSNQDLAGSISPAIGNLTELIDLDLSSNPSLGGFIPTGIGNLTRLTRFFAQYCNLSGPIPSEIGNIHSLRYLVLFENRLVGPLPDTIGFLGNLIWLDVSGNSLSGPLPVSATSNSGSGLDNLTNALHFHLQDNGFTGSLPPSMFHNGMQLLHLLLNNNQFSGTIPSTIGDLPSVQIICLDSNNLTGTIPSNITAIKTLTTLQLSMNGLSDQLPDLSSLTELQMLKVGNNLFDASTFPSWITNLQTLYLLSMDSSNLNGTLPPEIFSFSPYLSNVSLGSNGLSGTLNLTQANLTSLKLVNLTNNNITSLAPGNYTQELLLDGNPYCATTTSSCSFIPNTSAVSTRPPSNCTNECPDGFEVNPKAPSGCRCGRPVTATCTFFATKVPSVSVFGISQLEQWFVDALKQSQYLQSVTINDTQTVVDIVSVNQVALRVFPVDNATASKATDAWTDAEAALVSYVLLNQDVEFPLVGAWGCVILGSPYSLTVVNGGSGLSIGAKIGIGLGAGIMAIIISVLAVYAWKLRERAVKAEKLNKPFEPWIRTMDSNTDPNIPQLKGARVFSFAELSKCTDNFSKRNEIGEGGYGKVYRGCLESGMEVAIKRARNGSLQGIDEFKNEVELLSRVHHRNLVGLAGFCYERGEQMLVYEYLPNGTLQDCLSGKTMKTEEIDWNMRIALALGSARGIAYLHTEANPPIIHSDIKSSNILLDEKLVAKVADFGLSKFVSNSRADNRLEHVTLTVKGTMGYLDPDYFMTNRVTDKSDVYSFGVVLLEVLTGRLPIQEGVNLVVGIRNALRGSNDVELVIREIVDPKLRDYPTAGAETLLGVAMSCVEDDPEKRPSMSEVVKELEEIQSLEEGGGYSSGKTKAKDYYNNNNNRRRRSSSSVVGSEVGKVEVEVGGGGASPRSTSTSALFQYSGSMVGPFAAIHPK